VEVQEGEEDKDGFVKACALIRSNLHIDPTAGSDDDFAQWYAEALWLEEMRLKMLADMMVHLFGERK
jgi:hypothetical protein